MRISWRVVAVVLVAASLATAFSTTLSVQIEQSGGVSQPVIMEVQRYSID